jgi:hypothetical protein
MANTFAGVRLPEKRDVLGRVIPQSTGQRVAGLNFGPESHDPLNVEMDRLSFALPRPKMSLMGVKLNPVQYEKLLELRGQVVKDPKTGLTMQGALQQMVSSPMYQQLPKLAKIEMWRRTISPYDTLAGATMVQQDHELARQVIQENTFNKMIVRGYSQQQINQQTSDFFKQLGLQPQQ